MTITATMRGIDFAFMPDHDGYAGVHANGAGFVSRYSAGVGGQFNGKCVQRGEIATAVAHGVDFLANFELSESTPEEGGRSGREHGAADRDFWADRGLAPGAGVIVSWEPGKDSSRFGAVADFLAAYRTALGRPIGLYAGLPALLFMRKRGLIDFTWLPMSSDASGLNFGNVSQQEYAKRMLQVGRDNGLNMVQNRNRWYFLGTDENGNDIFGADENIIVNLPGLAWSHMQAAGHAAPEPHHEAVHTPAAKIWQGARWPGAALGFGPQDHFGNINGPDASHGGATAAERQFVSMIQQRLVACGFVPGHTNPKDGWADGIFDVAGDGRLTGPTTEAVRRFQAAKRPGALTGRPGEVWSDDWATLFNLP